MTKPGVLAGASADPFDPVALEHRLIEARARRAAVLAARQDATRAAGPTSASPAPEITAPAAATMLAAPDAQGITHRPAGGELAVRHLVIAGACAALLLGAASVALTLHAESRVAALVRQDPPPTPDGPAPDVTIRLAALPDAEGAEPRPIAPALDAPVGAADPGRRVPPGVVAAEPGFDATSIAASREALRVVRAREDLRISRARDEMDAALAALRSVARGSLDDDAGAPEAPDLGDLRLILHAPPAVTQDHLAANLAALRAGGSRIRHRCLRASRSPGPTCATFIPKIAASPNGSRPISPRSPAMPRSKCAISPTAPGTLELWLAGRGAPRAAGTRQTRPASPLGAIGAQIDRFFNRIGAPRSGEIGAALGGDRAGQSSSGFPSEVSSSGGQSPAGAGSGAGAAAPTSTGSGPTPAASGGTSGVDKNQSSSGNRAGKSGSDRSGGRGGGREDDTSKDANRKGDDRKDGGGKDDDRKDRGSKNDDRGKDDRGDDG